MIPDFRLIPETDDTLRQPCRPVRDDELAGFHDDKFRYRAEKFLKASKGLAFAAPQIGDSRAWFLWAGGFVINPEVLFRSGATELLPEGCLSFPGRIVYVDRPVEIEVRYHDGHSIRQRRLHYMQARIFLHEFDHLNGTCIVP